MSGARALARAAAADPAGSPGSEVKDPNIENGFGDVAVADDGVGDNASAAPEEDCEENDKVEAEEATDTGRSVWFVAALAAPDGADRFGRGAAPPLPKMEKGLALPNDVCCVNSPAPPPAPAPAPAPAPTPAPAAVAADDALET